jgi:hypothetical protein
MSDDLEYIRSSSESTHGSPPHPAAVNRFHRHQQMVVISSIANRCKKRGIRVLSSPPRMTNSCSSSRSGDPGKGCLENGKSVLSNFSLRAGINDLCGKERKSDQEQFLVCRLPVEVKSQVQREQSSGKDCHIQITRARIERGMIPRTHSKE